MSEHEDQGGFEREMTSATPEELEIASQTNASEKSRQEAVRAEREADPAKREEDRRAIVDDSIARDIHGVTDEQYDKIKADREAQTD